MVTISLGTGPMCHECDHRMYLVTSDQWSIDKGPGSGPEERGNSPRRKTTKFVHRPPQITNNVACNHFYPFAKPRSVVWEDFVK